MPRAGALQFTWKWPQQSKRHPAAHSREPGQPSSRHQGTGAGPPFQELYASRVTPRGKGWGPASRRPSKVSAGISQY